MPALEAVAIALALNVRGRNVLHFLFPIGGRGLLLATIGISSALVAAGAIGPSGAIAPFAGMLAGWWLVCSTIPGQRWWLRWRLQRLESETRTERAQRRVEAKRRFEVLPGGLDKKRNDRYLH